ncbi:Hypothetical protein P9303_16431 [Prochlorococcus marinus str. MIT 9303]|uniref:Uncharacterized protein n=1 Tax=Prochlorococcus marinus (strain MIT 9303) TaxID=59922 RepID=A2CA77_PROM3|nr:Hypothetical protein P9303_16431 [Prochlorococcus marinus str. MIT 9303]
MFSFDIPQLVQVVQSSSMADLITGLIGCYDHLLAAFARSASTILKPAFSQWGSVLSQ